MKVESFILFLMIILWSFSAFPSPSFTREKRISLILDKLERNFEYQKEADYQQFSNDNEKYLEPGVIQKKISKYESIFPPVKSERTEKDEHKVALRKYLGENVRLSLGFQTGYIKGNSTYHISFSGGESELKFPLNATLLGLKVDLSMRERTFSKKERMGLSVSWYRDIRHTGKMEDSDWIYGDGHSGKDVYSESSTRMNLDIVDVNYVWNFLFRENLSLGTVMGYKYHRYSYEVFDTDQVGYGPWTKYTVYVPGSTLVYSVKHKFFYFGINSNLSLINNFFLDIQGGYSPWAKSEDRDDHILRYKLSKANCKGDAYFFQAKGLWDIASDLYFDFSAQWTKIDTKGVQHQVFYDGSGVTYDVNDKITSSYWLASASLNYLF